MTLRYLASQENTMEISNRFGLTECAFLKHKNQVIQCINNNILCKFIVWPSVTEMDAIATNCNDAKAYYNRKRFHSVILQGICKDDMQLIHTNIGWPGRVHDAKVEKISDVWETGYQKCEYGRFQLVGDAAYPLRVWLLTPYRDTGHLSRQQTNLIEVSHPKDKLLSGHLDS